MDAKLMEMVGVQLAFEEKQAEALKPLVGEVKNSIVKTLLSSLMWDSMKHAAMFQTLIDLNGNQVIWDVNKQQMIKKLNYHINAEKKMIEGLQNILNVVEDEKTKPWLEEILADEKRHHRILNRLREIVQSIDVSKEDWIDFYRARLQEEWPGF